MQLLFMCVSVSVISFIFQKISSVEFDDVKRTMTVLEDLSQQLDPLETAYADVRFFDVDVEQTDLEFSNLISAMNDEMNEENALNDQAKQMLDEIGRVANRLVSESTVDGVDRVCNLCIVMVIKKKKKKLDNFFFFLFDVDERFVF